MSLCKWIWVNFNYRRMMLDTGRLPLSGDALRWYKQGLAASAGQQYDHAVAWFDQVLQFRPDFYEAWYERGLALEHWGFYAEAIASFDQALRLQPKSSVAYSVWHARGNALQYGLGDYLGAIACYDQALALNSTDELTWQNRGNALLYGLTRPEDAIACYDRMLQINPDNYLGWRNRGNALVELRRFSEAIASYNRALSLNPDDEVSWHARNLASERSGLHYKLPTTQPSWQATSVNATEGEPDSTAMAPDREVAYEHAPIYPAQPVLILKDDSGRRELVLEADQYVLGRDPKCDIQLFSQFVSRQHAVLKKVHKANGSIGYQIVDGNPEGKLSTNGLMINGQKHSSKELRSEDVVVFGPHVQATYRSISTTF